MVFLFSIFFNRKLFSCLPGQHAPSETTTPNKFNVSECQRDAVRIARTETNSYKGHKFTPTSQRWILFRYEGVEDQNLNEEFELFLCSDNFLLDPLWITPSNNECSRAT